jgi:serine protease Do
VARDFQVSLPIQPGNSGGPLLDKRGNVVGVIAAKLDASVTLSVTGTLPENVNFAVKSTYLLAFLESCPSILRELSRPQGAPYEPSIEELAKSVARVIVSH